jgi:aspartyl-tRNA(Asn)/glutamyl-tRNA(Gln) amidotransferase subunit C
MNITRDDIIHVANLARLEMDEESIDKFTVQIDEILKYVETLNSVDTEGVAPTTHAIFLTNAFRDDEEKQSFSRDDLLENAPENENGNFIVPKVVG